MRIIFKKKVVKAQQHGYDCGVYAIRYLLFLFFGEVRYSSKYISIYSKVSRKNGLSPDLANRFLKLESQIRPVKKYLPDGYRWKTVFEKESDIETLKANLPAMVNYQEEGEGHWSVIISSINGRFLLYDPWKGDLKFYSEEEFDKIWFSKRYYKKCFISITN